MEYLSKNVTKILINATFAQPTMTLLAMSNQLQLKHASNVHQKQVKHAIIVQILIKVKCVEESTQANQKDAFCIWLVLINEKKTPKIFARL